MDAKDGIPRAGQGSDPTLLSRGQSVRRALDAGFEGAEEGMAYLRSEFGIELTQSQFLAAKATERKRGWTKGGKPGRKPKHSAGVGGGTLSIDRQDDYEEQDLD